MHKIVVLNPKGGSGKSTLATNLASYFAVQNCKPTLLDMDPQGSSMRWLGKRNDSQPTVYGVAGYERKAAITRSFALRAQGDSHVTIVDTPAALEAQRLTELIRDAQHILVPVLPSDIDIHAATRCIANLLLIAKVDRNTQRIAVVANRVKRNTLMYQRLMKFLQSLQIPVVTTLRDAQVYVRAYDAGVGLFEMKRHSVREDLEQWQPILGWLNNKTSMQTSTTTTHAHQELARASLSSTSRTSITARQPVILKASYPVIAPPAQTASAPPPTTSSPSTPETKSATPATQIPPWLLKS